MRKVLIFSLNFFPKYVGGAEVAIKELVERVQADTESSFEFHLITLRFDSALPKYEFLYGIHVYRIGFTKRNATIADLKDSWLKYNKYYFQIFAFLKAVQLHLKYKFDFTWAMMAHASGVPAGLFKIFFPKVVYTLNLQEGDPPEYIETMFKKPILWYFFKYSFSKADVVFSLSTYLQDWATRMGAKNKNIVIPNAVDYTKFSRKFSIQEIQKVQDNLLCKKNGDIWLVTTSRLVHKNAIDDVISSLKFLSSNIKFLIIGIGPEEKRLKDLVANNNLIDRVIFAGEIKNSELPIILQACDIFIRPSRSEGFGISFVEAMAAGIPVIATLEGGISDFLFDKKTGYVCNKDNPESIAKAVNYIMGNAELKNQVVAAAKKMVQEKYNWDVISKVFQKEILNKK